MIEEGEYWGQGALGSSPAFSTNDFHSSEEPNPLEPSFPIYKRRLKIPAFQNSYKD